MVWNDNDAMLCNHARTVCENTKKTKNNQLTMMEVSSEFFIFALLS